MESVSGGFMVETSTFWGDLLPVVPAESFWGRTHELK